MSMCTRETCLWITWTKIHFSYVINECTSNGDSYITYLYRRHFFLYRSLTLLQNNVRRTAYISAVRLFPIRANMYFCVHSTVLYRDSPGFILSRCFIIRLHHRYTLYERCYICSMPSVTSSLFDFTRWSQPAGKKNLDGYGAPCCMDEPVPVANFNKLSFSQPITAVNVDHSQIMEFTSRTILTYVNVATNWYFIVSAFHHRCTERATPSSISLANNIAWSWKIL